MSSHQEQSTAPRGGTSIVVKVPVGIMNLARAAKREPHLIVWSVGRHVAGRAQSVDRAALQGFVQKHQIFSRSRLNAIIREGDGDFWVAKMGKISQKPVLHLRGMARIITAILRSCPGA